MCAAQYTLERLPKLRIKNSINNWIQRGVEVPQPEEEAHHVRIDAILAQRHHQGEHEEGQPTHDEGPGYYGESLCGFAFSLRLHALLLLSPRRRRQKFINRRRTRGWVFDDDGVGPANVADVALVAGRAVVGRRRGRLLRRDVVGDRRHVGVTVCHHVLMLGFGDGEGSRLLPVAPVAALAPFVDALLVLVLFLDDVHSGGRLTLGHYQRSDQCLGRGRLLVGVPLQP